MTSSATFRSRRFFFITGFTGPVWPHASSWNYGCASWHADYTQKKYRQGSYAGRPPNSRDPSPQAKNRKTRKPTTTTALVPTSYDLLFQIGRRACNCCFEVCGTRGLGFRDMGFRVCLWGFGFICKPMLMVYFPLCSPPSWGYTSLNPKPSIPEPLFWVVRLSR